MEEEEKRISTLREVILEGMESGIAHDFKPDTQLEKIKAKRSRMAKYSFTNKAVEDLTDIWNG